MSKDWGERLVKFFLHWYLGINKNVTTAMCVFFFYFSLQSLTACSYEHPTFLAYAWKARKKRKIIFRNEVLKNNEWQPCVPLMTVFSLHSINSWNCKNVCKFCMLLYLACSSTQKYFCMHVKCLNFIVICWNVSNGFTGFSVQTFYFFVHSLLYSLKPCNNLLFFSWFLVKNAALYKRKI